MAHQAHDTSRLHECMKNPLNVFRHCERCVSASMASGQDHSIEPADVVLIWNRKNAIEHSILSSHSKFPPDRRPCGLGNGECIAHPVKTNCAGNRSGEVQV